MFSWWLTALAAVAVPSAQARSPWFGTWKLNVAKSLFRPAPPYKGATRRIEPVDGGIIIIDDLVRSRGGILHLEWTGKFDGRDYPVQGVEIVLTNAYRCADSYTCELTQRTDGEVSAVARLQISPDGGTLVTVTSSRSGGTATTIYEKQ